MSQYTKHREEKDIYELSFEKRVASAETISSPEVRVSQAVLDEWIDVTTDILGVVVVVGSKVQFTLTNATDGIEQHPGQYRVFVKVNTSQGRILVGEGDLEVLG